MRRAVRPVLKAFNCRSFALNAHVHSAVLSSRELCLPSEVQQHNADHLTALLRAYGAVRLHMGSYAACFSALCFQGLPQGSLVKACPSTGSHCSTENAATGADLAWLLGGVVTQASPQCTNAGNSRGMLSALFAVPAANKLQCVGSNAEEPD